MVVFGCSLDSISLSFLRSLYSRRRWLFFIIFALSIIWRFQKKSLNNQYLFYKLQTMIPIFPKFPDSSPSVALTDEALYLNNFFLDIRMILISCDIAFCTDSNVSFSRYVCWWSCLFDGILETSRSRKRYDLPFEWKLHESLAFSYCSKIWSELLYEISKYFSTHF